MAAPARFLLPSAPLSPSAPPFATRQLPTSTPPLAPLQRDFRRHRLDLQAPEPVVKIYEAPSVADGTSDGAQGHSGRRESAVEKQDKRSPKKVQVSGGGGEEQSGGMSGGVEREERGGWGQKQKGGV